jgi:hypothetical protein
MPYFSDCSRQLCSVFRAYAYAVEFVFLCDVFLKEELVAAAFFRQGLVELAVVVYDVYVGFLAFGACQGLDDEREGYPDFAFVVFAAENH